MKNKKDKTKFLDALADNIPNNGMFEAPSLKDTIKELNKEYPKLLKAINSKKLTQQQKKRKAEQFTQLLEELVEHYTDS